MRFDGHEDVGDGAFEPVLRTDLSAFNSRRDKSVVSQNEYTHDSRHQFGGNTLVSDNNFFCIIFWIVMIKVLVLNFCEHLLFVS